MIICHIHNIVYIYIYCKDTNWSTAQEWLWQWPNKSTIIDLLENGLDWSLNKYKLITMR